MWHPALGGEPSRGRLGYMWTSQNRVATQHESALMLLPVCLAVCAHLNNDASGHALNNARTLRQIMGISRVVV